MNNTSPKSESNECCDICDRYRIDGGSGCMFDDCSCHSVSEKTEEIGYLSEIGPFHCLRCHLDIPMTSRDYRLAHVQKCEKNIIWVTNCGRLEGKECEFTPKESEEKCKHITQFVIDGKNETSSNCIKCGKRIGLIPYPHSSSEPTEDWGESWKPEFYVLCKRLNLREETVSGFDEIGEVHNFILNLLNKERENAHKEGMELRKDYTEFNADREQEARIDERLKLKEYVEKLPPATRWECEDGEIKVINSDDLLTYLSK